jgi:hypothetical protein
VLGGIGKIIIDDKIGSGVVPYLPLDQVTRPPGGAASPSTAGGGVR